MSKSRSRQQRSGCGSLFAAAGTLFTIFAALIGAIVKAAVSILRWLNRQKFTVPIRGKNINVSLLGVLGLLVLVFSCCGITYGGMDLSLREAGILPTYTLVPTNTPTRTYTPQPTSTSTPVPTPTRTPTPRPSPSPTPTPVDCTWSAAYVADVTIPDGTRLDPGTPFVKTWRIRNDGTCDWEDVRLTFTSGEQMQAPSSVPIPFTAAGAEVDISVEMVAPAAVGDYSAGWSICQRDNCFYKVTVQIVSGDLPTAPPPQPTEAPQPAQPTPAPAPVCDCSGDLYNCSSFSTHRAAQACFDYCVGQGRGDIHRLDRNNDGIVCESLP
jgi:hypothetical protein